MPQIRTSKGSLTAFTPARLSALLTLVWQTAYGEEAAARHRREITGTTQTIWDRLVEAYGGEPDVEWRGPEIGRTIGAHLELHASWEVHEAWMSLRVAEFQDSPTRQPIHQSFQDKTQSEQEKLEQQKSKAKQTLGGGTLDPVWGILDLSAVRAGIPQNSTTSAGTPEHLGEVISTRGRVRVAPHQVPVNRQQQTRSQWLTFWRWLAEEAGVAKNIPLGRWETLIHQQPPVRKLASQEGWWSWWQDRIDEAVARDPRLHELRHLASIRRRRNAINGCSWLDGSLLCPEREPIRLDSTPTGIAWYQRFGVEHLQRVTKSVWPSLKWDWVRIGKALDPSQDERMNWAAWQSMDAGGALWKLSEPWSQGEIPGAEAKELPQWALMRAALALAAERAPWGRDGLPMDDGDEGIRKRSEDAIRFYNAMAHSHIIPAAAVLREAGRLHPKWMDDGAWWVGDDYSGMQTAIHESAVGTAWMGSRALELSAVRSRGAPVREGHRAAAGLPPLVDLLSAQMAIQGRDGVDRPLTVSLPAWHRDLPEILEKRQQGEGQGIQLAVLASDVFIKRAIEGAPWTLFDPHAYPEVLEGESGYLKAETLIDERKKKFPHGHRVMDAARLLRSCLAQLGRGELDLNFTSVSDAFGPGQGRRLHGRDGIGTFFLPDIEVGQSNTTAVTWPALAVNLVPLVDRAGNTHQDLLARNIRLAFEFCERLYMGQDRITGRLPTASIEIRPICIGVIGLHEAVVTAREGNLDDTDDLASWIQRMAMLVGTQAVAADAQLAEQHGPAPVMDPGAGFGRKLYNPKEGYLRLTEKRGGGLGMRMPGTFPNGPDEPIPEIYGKHAPRYTARLVWAPFQQAARWAGVSPGGFGTLFPYEWVADEDGVMRQSPTPYLQLEMARLANEYEPGDFGTLFKYPTKPQRWPEKLRHAVFPDLSETRNRLMFASGVRPWIDQGVSMTLPANGFRMDELMTIAQQAWWYGIDNLRAEQRMYQPEGKKTEDDDPQDPPHSGLNQA